VCHHVSLKLHIKERRCKGEAFFHVLLELQTKKERGRVHTLSSRFSKIVRQRRSVDVCAPFHYVSAKDFRQRRGVNLRTPFLSRFSKIADKEELEAEIQHLEQRLNDDQREAPPRKRTFAHTLSFTFHQNRRQRGAGGRNSALGATAE